MNNNYASLSGAVSGDMGVDNYGSGSTEYNPFLANQNANWLNQDYGIDVNNPDFDASGAIDRVKQIQADRNKPSWWEPYFDATLSAAPYAMVGGAVLGGLAGGFGAAEGGAGGALDAGLVGGAGGGFDAAAIANAGLGGLQAGGGLSGYGGAIASGEGLAGAVAEGSGGGAGGAGAYGATPPPTWYSSIGQGALKGAGANGGITAATGGNLDDVLKAAGKGALAGGIGGGLTYANPAGQLGQSGITGNVINGAVRGGTSALLNGGSVGSGALTGGVMAGGNSAFNGLLNTLGGGMDFSGGGGFGSFSNGGADSAFGDQGGGTSNFSGGDWGMDLSGLGSYGGSGVGNYLGGEGAYAPPSMDTSSPDWMNYLKKNGAGLAGGLAGLYFGHKQANQIKDARSQLDQLYTPNSPYATQMRSNIMRADAAAGRRTQIAPRETQLAGALTQARSGVLNSPQYQNLIQAGIGSDRNSLAQLLALYQRGTFNGLGGALSSAGSSLAGLF